jgi:hypothetical protein
MARPALPTILLDKTCDIYTEAAGGDWATVAQADLPCRLGIVSAKGAGSAPERAELTAIRRLVWGPDYDMPERCQVEVDGIRYNPVPGSFTAPTWPGSGAVVYRSCDLVRAE